ncbi:isochorismatase family protein [uncultured Caulobacter sp.]|jgi:nicotinamidase-related amidase|uniref:isochorismatase family protein n=1 Tax=uncultured Caulobacter sp. TaxID=158749 RepID=UPI00263558EC|nr:isochorismatase family protein [uncultured Caulobacter sp.]
MQAEPTLGRRDILAGIATATGAILVAAADPAAAQSQPQPKETRMRPKSGFRALTTENTALVLVDHQVGTIGWAGELANQEERDQLKMWTRTIARFAKAAGMPIVLTSSLETEAQGPLLPEFQQILPQEYAARIRRTGVINAWDDPAFAAAVRATGKHNLLIGGLTTDVCLVPPALSAKEEGFNVVALVDISAATTKLGARTSLTLLNNAGIDQMVVTPMITSMLGDYKNKVSAAFFQAMGAEGVFDAYARGNLR